MSINPLKIVQELKDDGFTENQAELILKRLMAAIQESDLVNKDFLESKLAVLKADLIAEGARRLTDLEITTISRMSDSEKRTANQIAELKTEMTGKFAESKTEITGQISESEKRVMSHITTLREDMYKLEIRLITWMVGAQLAAIVLILGIFYFFFSQILIKILPK